MYIICELISAIHVINLCVTGGGGNDPNGEGTSEPPTESNNIGAIVGGVVGGVVVIIAVGIGIFVVYMLCCRNKGIQI